MRLLNAKFFEEDRVSGGKMKWVDGVETNVADRYAVNVVWGEISFLGDLTKTGRKRKPYVGMFATNLRIANIDAADEVFCWGRRRWNIENVFKEQKRVEVGLKHRFVNRTAANKVWYCLMMMAWTIWQMCQRGFLLRLEVGCRKMTQLLWCEMIRTYVRYFGCVMLEPRHALMSRKNLWPAIGSGGTEKTSPRGLAPADGAGVRGPVRPNGGDIGAELEEYAENAARRRRQPQSCGIFGISVSLWFDLTVATVMIYTRGVCRFEGNTTKEKVVHEKIIVRIFAGDCCCRFCRHV